jgi:hypothetical protein
MSATVARELFIYWHVAVADADAARAAAGAMQARLRAQHAGLAARLYRRTGAPDDRLTLMETYARPAGGVDAALQGAIEAEAATALAAWCAGARHVEVFESEPG